MRAPSIFVALCLAYPRLALPCSLAPGVQTGLPQPISSPQPLLAAEYGRPPSLTHETGGPELRLEAVPTPVDLQGALGVSESLTFYRPVEPLAPGFYYSDGRRFEVRSEATPPSPGAQGTVRVYFAEEDELSLGCGGISSCGGGSSMTIELPEATLEPAFEGRYDHAMPTFLVSISGTQGVRRHLVSAASGWGDRVELRFYSADAEPFCLQVRGVSDQGMLGQTLDLGCIDPTNGDDPRVRGDAPGGCTSGSPRQIPLLGLLAAFWGVGWWRRRKS